MTCVFLSENLVVIVDVTVVATWCNCRCNPFCVFLAVALGLESFNCWICVSNLNRIWTSLFTSMRVGQAEEVVALLTQAWLGGIRRVDFVSLQCSVPSEELGIISNTPGDGHMLVNLVDQFGHLWTLVFGFIMVMLRKEMAAVHRVRLRLDEENAEFSGGCCFALRRGLHRTGCWETPTDTTGQRVNGLVKRVGN